MDKDLHVNPLRILAVCQVLRDRYETPTRLANAIDDPMPVDTGERTVNGETTRAIQRLIGRFDQFAEAMRRDAAGLVRSLQQYRATERATLAELEEAARSLERSGARPVLPVPAPDGPPAVQPPAAMRTPSWETVEAPLGGNCSRRLGQPEGIRALAQALLQSASGLDDLITTLRRQVNDLVPADWRGEGATAFKEQIEQQLRTGSTGIVERARKVGEAANKCADRLRMAWVDYADAQAIALRYDITIDDNCWVRPNRPDIPENRAAATRCHQLVEEAIREATGAQNEFRLALAETHEERMEIWRPLLVSGMAGMMAAGRRGNRRTPTALSQLETTLRTAPRTKIGNVGPVPKHMLDANGQPGTDAGNLMHQRAAPLITSQYPGVRFSTHVGPGETGADIRVIGRGRGVRDPGFDYIEIKHDTGPGIGQFARNQWATPGFPGYGVMYTYDTAGNVYRVNTPYSF